MSKTAHVYFWAMSGFITVVFLFIGLGVLSDNMDACIPMGLFLGSSCGIFFGRHADENYKGGKE